VFDTRSMETLLIVRLYEWVIMADPGRPLGPERAP